MQLMWKIGFALTAAVGLCASGPASAEEVIRDEAVQTKVAIECGDSVTAEILGVLLAAGNIDESEYSASCAKLRNGDASTSPVSVAEDSSGAGPTWKFNWKNGFNLARSDGAFKLKFGGRVMLDAGLYSLNDRLKDGLEAAGADARHGSGIEIRRARLFFSGDVYERAFFKAQWDFAGDGDDAPDMKDLYVGLKRLGPIGSVKVGHFKEPLFLQEATSSKYITFMERGLNSVFYPGRNVGVLLDGNLADKRVLWQIGAFRDVNDQGFSFDGSGNAMWDVAVRLSAAPLYSDDGEHVVHLGTGYIHRFLDSGVDNLRYRARPAAHLGQRFVDTESFGAFETDILNVEFAYVCGPFSLQAEFTNTWVDGARAQEDLEFRGAYAFVSYFFTGEHRNYELGKGQFGRLEPIANFDPANGGWGAVEVAVRYSYLDLVNRNIDGGDIWEVTAGLNWYLYPNLRAMLNYVHADVSNRDTSVPTVAIDGVADIIEARVQIDF